MAHEGDKPILLGASEGEVGPEVTRLRRLPPPKEKEDAAAGEELSHLLARRRARIQEQDTFESVVTKPQVDAASSANAPPQTSPASPAEAVTATTKAATAATAATAEPAEAPSSPPPATVAPATTTTQGAEPTSNDSESPSSATDSTATATATATATTAADAAAAATATIAAAPQEDLPEADAAVVGVPEVAEGEVKESDGAGCQEAMAEKISEPETKEGTEPEKEQVQEETIEQMAEAEAEATAEVEAKEEEPETNERDEVKEEQKEQEKPDDRETTLSKDQSPSTAGQEQHESKEVAVQKASTPEQAAPAQEETITTTTAPMSTAEEPVQTAEAAASSTATPPQEPVVAPTPTEALPPVSATSETVVSAEVEVEAEVESKKVADVSSTREVAQEASPTLPEPLDSEALAASDPKSDATNPVETAQAEQVEPAGPAEAPTDPAPTPTAVETPAEFPAQSPADKLPEIPAEPPAQPEADIPAETPTTVLSPAAAPTPAAAAAVAPMPTPAEAPAAEMPAEVPAETLSAPPAPAPAAPAGAAAPAPATTVAATGVSMLPEGISGAIPSGAQIPPAGEEDYSKEPIETRLASKDLERRCSAWSELATGMTSESEPNRPQSFELMKSHIDACLAETLPKGQGAALTALGAYLEHATDIEASEVLPLVRRLVEHKSIDKPKMQQLVPTVISLVAEIVECPAVVAELTACLTDLENAKKKIQGFFKKQVAVIIKLLSQLLRDFGPLKMAPKLGYVNLAVKYLSDTDRGIKESCYSVLVELSCWLGEEPDATKTLEEPQKKELSKRFDALSEEEKSRSQPPRHYRGEKIASGGQAGMAVDKYALAEAVDVLKKLPRGWTFEKVFGMEKWKDKQVHLQELYTLLDSATKLAPSEGYAALVPGLTRLIKTESNLPVLTEGAKVMGLLALKLRKDFERPARQLLPITLARMNDKSVWKPNILIERVEQLLWSVPFEFLLQELQPYLESKSLFVKKEAMHLLLRTLELPAVKAVHPDAAKQFFEALATPVVGLIDDSDNGVRHEAAKYLTVLVRANLEHPEIGPIVFDRIPPHRASAFEEEWKKAVRDVPCPLKSRSGAQSAASKSAAGEAGPVLAHSGRSSSNLKSRPEAAVEDGGAGARNGGRAVSPLRGLTPRGSRQGSPLRPRATTSKVGDSPSKPYGASPSRRPASPGGPSTQSRIRNASSDKAGAPEKAELPQQALANIEKMAQEIKSLRSTVAQLQQRDKDPIPPAPQTPRGSIEFRRPATPPKRPQSWDGSPAPRAAQPVLPAASSAAAASSSTAGTAAAAPATTTAPGATTPRRGSFGAAGPVPSPAKKALSPRPGQGQLREPTRQAFTRSNSADLLRKRAGRQDQIQPVPGLTRQGSHSTLATAAAAGRAPPTLDFAVYEPRMAKQQRQDRERCQYWGPDKIPAEYLSGLKDCWKQSVGLQLTKLMFSDKLEEQLVALQSWKMKVTEEHSNIDLVLDMLLKWLTWMLFNANTQIWRGVTEVLSLTLRSLEQAQLTLTEREAQILLPNLLERSGHNIASVREGMEALIRQTVGLHPKAKLLPMLMLGLQSKSKRSAACAMRGLGDAMDKSLASALARSQKDLSALLKVLEDKDVELRKAAVQTVASMSQHMDAPAFARITRGLPPTTQQALRSAAAKMVPMPANTFSMSAGDSAIPNPPLSARLTRNRSGSALVLQPPNTARDASQREDFTSSSQPQPQQRPQRLSQPSSRTEREPDNNQTRRVLEAPVERRESREHSQLQEPVQRPRRSSVGSVLTEIAPASPAPSPATGGPNSASASEEVNSIVREVALSTAPIGQLSDRLLRCGSNQDFATLAATLKTRMKQVKEDEAPGLADALVESMRVYLGHDRNAERCKPLVDVLEEFCSSRDCLQPLPSSMLRGLLREQLKHLHHSKWTTQIEGGAALLRSINLSCVMLLNHLPRSLALSLLLQLGTEESEIVASSLVVKCLRKVTKGLANHRDVQGESGAILDSLSTWLRRAQPRLSSLLGCLRETSHGVTPKSLVDAAVCTLLEGVREVVDLVQSLAPEVAETWASKLRSEERKLLEACHKPVGLVDAEVQDKENVPVVGMAGKKGDTNTAAAPRLSVTRPAVA